MCERQHVQAPRTQLAVVGDRDEIVAVLGPQHCDTADWVLWSDMMVIRDGGGSGGKGDVCEGACQGSMSTACRCWRRR